MRVPNLNPKKLPSHKKCINAQFLQFNYLGLVNYVADRQKLVFFTLSPFIDDQNLAKLENYCFRLVVLIFNG